MTVEDDSELGVPQNSKTQDYAIVLLVKEILDQIDELAGLRKKGLAGQLSLTLLQEMCAVLPELTPELQERYFEILVSVGSKIRHVRPSATVSAEMEAAAAVPKRRTIKKIAATLGLEAA
ncbi:MAG: hypothetical protein KDD60_10340 [Bdellovibrionales bacterium]|nr:hypothetical protein [Bdellovibrionales bacterium]